MAAFMPSIVAGPAASPRTNRCQPAGISRDWPAQDSVTPAAEAAVMRQRVVLIALTRLPPL